MPDVEYATSVAARRPGLASAVMRTASPSRIAWLGVNRLSVGCLLVSLVLGGIVAALALHGQMRVTLDEPGQIRVTLLGLCAIGWGAFLVTSGPRRMWLSAEMLAAILLTGILTSVVVFGQYVSQPLRLPLVDHLLLAGDVWLGIDTPALVEWTSRHPWLHVAMRRAYYTMTPQLLLIVPVLRLLKDRRAIWEYVFHYHVCLTATIVIFTLWPASGVYTVLDYTPLVSMATPAHHIEIFRSGAQRVITWGAIDGLVSMPSFHSAVGLFVTWAVRRHWWLLLPVGLVNLLLILGTVLLGVHYAVDVVATIAIFSASVVVYRRLERWILNGTLDSAAGAQAPASTPA
jgi:hypothetical protein